MALGWMEGNPVELFWKTNGMHNMVMQGKVMCAVAISKVDKATVPVDAKIVLGDIVCGHCFGPFEFDNLIGNAGGSGVISLNRYGTLGTAKFFKCGADGFGIMTVMEWATKLNFPSGGDNFN